LIGRYSCGYNGDMAGRPKKPDDEARDNVLRIRLTTEERKTLDEAAKARGLESSTWARMELLTLAKKLLRAK
jgi:uncharacterized protein (DUF1778 family)